MVVGGIGVASDRRRIETPKPSDRQTLGLTVPAGLLAAADEVIE
jgi:hypothetical protein